MKSITTVLATLLLATQAFAQEQNLVKNVDAVLPDQSQISVLATGFAQTLYTFDMDSADASACNAKCAEVWPPITVTPDEASTLKGDLGSISRASGLLQLTFKGQPVYLFHLDRVAGDIKGDGVGGVWHIIKN